MEKTSWGEEKQTKSTVCNRRGCLAYYDSTIVREYLTNNIRCGNLEFRKKRKIRVESLNNGVS